MTDSFAGARILSGFELISKWILWALAQVFNQYETAWQGGITLLESLCACFLTTQSSAEMDALQVLRKHLLSTEQGYYSCPDTEF